MPLNLTVHHFKKHKGGQFVAIDKVTPYFRIRHGTDGVAIFMQGGRAYGAGGASIKVDDLPKWISEELDIMNKKVLAECGWEHWQDILAKVKQKTTQDRETGNFSTQLKRMSDAELKEYGLSRGEDVPREASEVEKTANVSHTKKRVRKKEKITAQA